jgi:hypothetical protein
MDDGERARETFHSFYILSWNPEVEVLLGRHFTDVYTLVLYTIISKPAKKKFPLIVGHMSVLDA